MEVICIQHPLGFLLLEVVTACFDMKEDRNEKSNLICDRWEMIDEVTSDLVRDTYSKRKSITWFTSSHEGDESTDLFLDMDFSE